MKVGKIILVLALASAVAGCLTSNGGSGQAKKPKALLVMLDGLRADALDAAYTPAIDSLRNGTWAPGYRGCWSNMGLNVPDARPSSAANHTAILTAVDAVKSRVYNNGQTKNGNYKEWPTWLTRVTRAVPGTKGLFIYSWGEGNQYARTENVQFIHASDQANGDNIGKLLAAPDAPDVTEYFVDLPDHGGHGYGFYPMATEYLRTVYQSDVWVGRAIAAIKNRPTFKDEDWIIAVTGDHGGYLRTHGCWGGQASTVPLVLAGRNTPSGRLPGAPRHYDLTATALAHFGLDPVALKLEGRTIVKAAPETAPRALKDGLVAFFDFQGKVPVNAVKNGPVAKLEGNRATSGVGTGFLRFAEGTNTMGGVKLEGSEKLAFEHGTDFAFAVWARLPATQRGDSVIFSNKDWQYGVNPGMAFVAAKQMEAARSPGVVFNCGMPNRSRVDIGQMDVEPGEWSFYAVVRNSEGVCTVYQGRSNGQLSWCCARDTGMLSKTNLPFYIGQDGTGKYGAQFTGDLDNLAFWTRSLTHEDVKAIFEAGRKGLNVGDLL